MDPTQDPVAPSNIPQPPDAQSQNYAPGGVIQPTVAPPSTSYNPPIAQAASAPPPSPQVTTPAYGSPPPAPPSQTNPVFGTNPAPSFPSVDAQPIQPPSKKSKRKLLAVVASVGILLLGSSAAAYFGYYVPNKPQNVLLSALENTASQKQIKSEGVLNFDELDETSGQSTLSAKVNMTSQVDASKNVAQLGLDVVVSGVKLSGELRYVDNNLYFQLKNLTDVKSLADSFVPDPGTQTAIDELIAKFSNQWIAVDSTVLKQAKVTCTLSTLMPSSQDFKLLEKNYKKAPFADITTTAKDSISGKAATRYEITVNDNKLADYINAAKGSAYLKKQAGCFGSDTSGLKGDSLRDNDKTSITIWVDKSKKLVSKVATHSSKQYESKNHVKDDLALTLTYGNVSVTKPDNAKSIVQLISELSGGDATDLLGGFTGVLGGSGGTDSSTQSGIQQKARDSERKTDINALHGQAEAYQAQNGRYPTLANFNSSAFRAANLEGLDPAALQDPKGTAQTLLAAPAANGYAYQVTPAGCDNAAKGDCMQYTMTATLEGGGTYVKQSLN